MFGYQPNLQLIILCICILYSILGLCLIFIYCLDLATEMSVWDGVVVSPLTKAYEKPVDKKDDENPDDMDQEHEDTMETQDN